MKHELIMENWRRYIEEAEEKGTIDSLADKVGSFADQAAKNISKTIDKAESTITAAMDAANKIQSEAENYLQAVEYKKPQNVMDYFQPQPILNSLMLLNTWSFFQKLIDKYTRTIKSVGASNNDAAERMTEVKKLKRLQPWQINAASFAKLQMLVSTRPDPQGPRGQLDLDIQKFRNIVVKKSFTSLDSAREYADKSIKKTKQIKNNMLANLKKTIGLNENVLADSKEAYNKIRNSIIASIPNENLRNLVKKYINNKEQLANDTIKKIVIEKSIQGLALLVAAMAIILTISRLIGYVVKKLGKKALAAAAIGGSLTAIVGTFFAAYGATTGLLALDKMIDDSNRFSDKILGVERIGKQINQILPNFKSAAKGQKQAAKSLINTAGAKKSDCDFIVKNYNNSYGRRLRPDCFE